MRPKLSHEWDMISEDRWKTFTKRDQQGHIAAEIFRARGAESDSLRRDILERAIALTDLTLSDEKWRADARRLLVLKALLADMFISFDGRKLAHLIKAL